MAMEHTLLLVPPAMSNKPLVHRGKCCQWHQLAVPMMADKIQGQLVERFVVITKTMIIYILVRIVIRVFWFLHD